MSPQTILSVGEFFGLQGLATRDAARSLIAEITRLEQPVVLDFQEIEAVSRSFVDELNNFLETAPQIIRLSNLNEELERLWAIVRQTADRKGRVTYDSLANAECLTL